LNGTIRCIAKHEEEGSSPLFEGYTGLERI
jgi:hypothetical protein